MRDDRSALERRQDELDDPIPDEWFEHNEPPRVFAVTIRRPDGSFEEYQRIGGATIDHTMEAIDRSGEGASIRVRRLQSRAAP